jgi:hypothetical protein
MNNRDKHTPGPWQLTRDNNLLLVGATGAGNICLTYTRVLTGDPEANARLIAAAPDLLEAARAAVNAKTNLRKRGFNANENDYKAMYRAEQMLKAAVAKAEGREK